MLKKHLFYDTWTLLIRITIGWNKECLRREGDLGAEHFIKDSCEAIFRTLDDAWGGGRQKALLKIAAKLYLGHLGVQNPLYKIAMKQCLGCLMTLYDGWWCLMIWWPLMTIDDTWWHLITLYYFWWHLMTLDFFMLWICKRCKARDRYRYIKVEIARDSWR